MNTVSVGIMYIGISISGSLIGLYLVRRLVSPQVIRAHHEIAGFIIAVLGVIYAVLLAFVVIVVWERFGSAETIVTQEANGIASVFRLAHGFPEPIQSNLRRQARDYATAVIQQEWSDMAKGDFSPEAQQKLDRLWETASAIQPSSNRENALYTELMTRMDDLGNSRRMRLLYSREGIPMIMWLMLYVGGITTVAFTFFFMAENFRLQMAMTIMLSGNIALILFLISALDYPFTGDVRVKPEAFAQVVEHMDYIEKNELAMNPPKSSGLKVLPASIPAQGRE